MHLSLAGEGVEGPVSGGQRGMKTKRPRLPRNLSIHTDRQSCTGDTMIAKSREMTGRSQTLLCWLGGGGVKTTENKIHWPRWWRG